ncbi:MAG: tetratricopeptide repeat protein, partial [Thermoguttaceae bacterium]
MRLEGIRAAKIRREAEGYLELGMPQHALQTLGRLGDPARFGVESLYLWGEGLRAMRRHFEALMPLERASRLAPKDIRVRLALGWCYKRTGRLDLAVNSLERALAAQPDEPLLRYNLACYLSLAGQKRRALRYLSQAMS